MLPLIEPTGSLSYSLFWWLVPIVFVLVLIGFILYRLLSRLNQPKSKIHSAPKLTRSQIRQKYLTQINEIEKFSSTLKPNQYRQAYLLLSATIRNYVDDISAQHTIAMTSQEFKQLKLSPAENVILLCSKYSFSLKTSSKTELDDQINLARSFINSWG